MPKLFLLIVLGFLVLLQPHTIQAVSVPSRLRLFKNIRLTKKATVASPKTQASSLIQNTSPSLSESQNLIMEQINTYRRSLGLSSVKTDTNTCNFADLRAREISDNFTHDGFRNRLNDKTLPYPSYSEVTENIAMTTSVNEVVSMWINSSGHAENMRKDTPFVCVVKSGNYYAYEGWRP